MLTEGLGGWGFAVALAVFDVIHDDSANHIENLAHFVVDRSHRVCTAQFTFYEWSRGWQVTISYWRRGRNEVHKTGSHRLCIGISHLYMIIGGFFSVALGLGGLDLLIFLSFQNELHT